MNANSTTFRSVAGMSSLEKSDLRIPYSDALDEIELQGIKINYKSPTASTQ